MKSLFCFMLTLMSIFTLTTDFTLAQQLRWRVLPAGFVSPTRLEDICFINANTGWTITNYSDQFGGDHHHIFKTTNGGKSWSDQSDSSSIYYRCIGFADSLNGWIGMLSRDNVPIIRTTNGGANWFPSLVTPITDTNNVCGLSVINKNIVYGCGRYCGPSRFYKTTNGGVNWTVKDMSQYATGLVDIHFFSADSGFVVGGTGGIWPDMNAVVLFTSDGGETWVERHRTVRSQEWGWKISFPTRNTAYISLESWISDNQFLKTTNGGVNWIEKPFVSGYNQEGIGFINENTGWLGGGPMTYKTTNGGDNWFADNIGARMNRFRFINDTLGYAVGQKILKFSRDSTTGINVISNEIPAKFYLEQNYPNPFNPGTKIRFEVASPTADMRLEVYNSLGQLVETLVDKILRTGTYEVEFSAANHPSGIYYYRLITNNYAEVKKMILVK
ncbi:MAG: T9SS type A sorting domain-containing protein [Bacteroidetes bacterium]|nr:T9SS type A sorting domain-containing protein [Bacteroidota bacterium]